METDRTGFIDLPSGVGLVLANMIGAGVLLSAGFMAQSMGPGPILVAWVFGLGLALLGARAYGAIAAVSGESGGEYRYLLDYVHPALGYLAGWGSLLVGFSAPIAVDAAAVGAYANTLASGPDARITGSLVIVALTAVHARNVRSSKLAQDALVLVKVVLILGFVALGLAYGSWAWPSWQPPGAAEGGTEGFPFVDVLLQQYWIAFAFAGWNAAIYAAGEFRDPRRDVPRAMLIGCAAVGLLYLVVNWVFVANITPELAAVVFRFDETQVTLGHAVMEQLLGPAGGTFMSVLTLLAFVSAMSAMTLVGPRVYAAMARDGYLPAALAGREGQPPVGSLILQAAVSLLFLWSHSILEAVQSTSLVIMLFSGLTVLSVFRIRARPDLPDPPLSALLAGGAYAIVVFGLIAIGLLNFTKLSWTAGAMIGVPLVFYGITAARRQASQAS